MNQIAVSDGLIYAKSMFTDKTTMFFSVPYEQGWKCAIDGKTIQPKCFANTFIVLELPEGEHEIWMRYEVDGLTAGIVVTAFSMLGIIWIIVIDLHRKRKKEDEKRPSQ